MITANTQTTIISVIIDLTVIFQIIATPLYHVAQNHGSAMLSNDDKTRYAKKLDIIFKDSDAIEPLNCLIKIGRMMCLYGLSSKRSIRI